MEHAAGRSYPDLVRLRSGEGLSAPDAVLAPGSAEQVRAVLDVCARERVAVVPFGGGTSVVGGVEPVGDGFAGVVSLDLRGLDRVLDVDRESLTATLEGGLLGPAAEARLGEQGLTLGHFPQSFEFSTVGGWVATRSAGQASTGYGRIDDLVEGVRLISPVGELDCRAVPASAAGPVAARARGRLGGRARGHLRGDPAGAAGARSSAATRAGRSAASPRGREAFRVMEQADASPDIARLSDEHETRMSLALASSGSRTERLGRAYLRARGHEGGCLAIVGFEGEAEEVERRRVRAARAAARRRRAGAGLAARARPGCAAASHGPYLRDHLLDRGVMVETLETATTWSNLDRLYARRGRRAAQRALGARHAAARDVPRVAPLPLGRLALLHLPGPPGGRRPARSVAGGQDRGLATRSWPRAARSPTTTPSGATTRPWMPAEVGPLGIELLRAAKATLDPAGVMNPGKLLPD